MINNIQKIPNDILNLLEKKITNFHEIIQKTILYVQKNKMLDILGVSDLNICVTNLCDINTKLNRLTDTMLNDVNTKKNNYENVIAELQNINNDLSGIFKLYGTEHLEDLLIVCFGNSNYANIITDLDKSKFDLIKKFFHPTSYKLLVHKKEKEKENDKNIKINSDEFLLDEKSKNLECIQISLNYKSFHLKVYGIQIVFHPIKYPSY
jgi:hypothetical protein